MLKGGLYAANDGHLNQLTEDPADSEPDFSADGTTIAFVRGGDVYSVRADGSGQRRLTSGPEVDGRPQFSPNGRTRRLRAPRVRRRRPRDLYTVNLGGSARALADHDAYDEHEASFSADGAAIVFVRSVRRDRRRHRRRHLLGAALGGRPGPPDEHRPLDEFAPRYFGGGIVFSRGQSGEGPGAYADIYTMRRNGSNVRVAGRAAPARPSSKTSRRRPHAALPPRPGPLGEADRPRPRAQADRVARRFEDQRGLLLRRAPGRRLHRRPRKPRRSRRSTSPAAAAPSSPKASLWKAAPR